MFFRIVFRALHRQLGKRALIALTVMLGIALATAILSVMLDIGDKVNAELKTYGANIVVRPQGISVVNELYGEIPKLDAGGSLNETDLGKLKTIFWAYNIVDFAPFLDTSVTLKQNGQLSNITLVGTWFAKDLVLPTGENTIAGVRTMRSWWDIRGTWITDADTTSTLVGITLAEKLGIDIGQSLTVSHGGENITLEVAGIVDSGSVEDEQLITTLDTVQKLAGRPDAVSKVEVSALTTPDNELSRRAAQDPTSLSAAEWETWYCTAYVSAIAYQIEEVLPSSAAKIVRQVAESEGVVLEKTQLLMLLITALSLIGTALGIANLVTASVMERAAEIGLIKALGATNRAVIALILTETYLVGLFGGLCGYGLGLVLAELIGSSVFGAAIAFNPTVIPIVALLLFGVITLGSLPAIRFLLALLPGQVLHGR